MATPTVLTQTPVTTNFSITAKQIQMTDLYGSTGAYTGTYNIPSNSDIKGCFVVTAPGGTTIYSNTNFSTPDVNGATPVWTLNVALPLNGDGTIVQGLYTVVYTSQINDGIHALYYVVNTATYTFNYSTPQVVISQVVDCVSPLFTTTDSTNYTVGSTNPTTQTRTMTLYYPNGTNTSTSNNIITTSTFYSAAGGAAQITTVSTVLVYTLPATGSYATYTISDTATGNKQILVDCTYICDISCCLQALESRMSNALQVGNQREYQYLNQEFTTCMGYVELALISIQCGTPQNVAGYITKIQTIANCTPGCNCSGSTPSLVVGLGGNAVNVVVQSGGSPITVSSSVGGGTTTYTVTLSSAFVALVNASYNTIVANTDGSVDVVPSGTNPKTYTLSVPSTVTNKTDVKCTIQFGSSVTIPGNVTITLASSLVTGTKFQESQVALSYAGGLGFPYQNNAFLVDNFFTASPDNNYRLLAVMSDDVTTYSGTVYSLRVFNREATPGAFYFQIIQGGSGSLLPATWSALAGNTYELTLTISE